MTLPKSLFACPHNTVLYQAVNMINGKKYIGITSAGLGKRVGRHFRTARLFQAGSAIGRAIRKYGQRYIKFSILVVCPNWEYAKQLEIDAIRVIKPEYNMTKGGDGAFGYRHTEEHKKYISGKLKGRQPWLGKRHTPETIEKMSKAAYRLRAQGIGGFQKGHNNPRSKKSIWGGAQES